MRGRHVSDIFQRSVARWRDMRASAGVIGMRFGDEREKTIYLLAYIFYGRKMKF